MNPNIMRTLGFDKEVEAHEAHKCTICFTPINFDEFKTELDKKEWGISGMCQKCQDKVFDGD